ncbi:alanine dehydrogenase [Parapedobacter koreensis]|uniref:Alanine dehydrogenase n=1 Tax=Parapedobacter koreensis TaxID=332977 RepID=A0A1H7L8M6_9SPHI|nr:alanine dehydrogenase [Parapedobacter koreensis]SEK95214.1 alanine dehydrogenase [Parapedobacter koreensis]
MIIGIPKEIKNNESRVALTASGVFELKQYGHHVLVEQGAGKGSGISDAEYESAGAEIVTDPHDIWRQAEMIVKVKEPIDEELRLARAGQIVFTYFHFASSIVLTEAMIGRGSVCIAYETVEKPDRSLPLLTPMSEVAGRMAVQQGARYLEKPVKGRGVLLGGVPGVPPGRVLILGAGIVGVQAAKMASGLGAHVTILDINTDRLRYINDILPPHVITQYSSQYTIRKLVQTHDLIIGAVLIPGTKAPNLVTRDMLKTMRPGTVIVDVAVDQGGCVETCVPTTHENPTYIIDDVLHYCVANMPGAVPFTSTLALTNSTLPYIINIANKGWKAACANDSALMKGLNVVEGKVVYRGVAEAFDLPLHDVVEVF